MNELQDISFIEIFDQENPVALPLSRFRLWSYPTGSILCYSSSDSHGLLHWRKKQYHYFYHNTKICLMTTLESYNVWGSVGQEKALTQGYKTAFILLQAAKKAFSDFH